MHFIIRVLPFLPLCVCVCVCTSQLSSPTPVPPSTSRQRTLQTSSVTFISCQKGSDLVTRPAPQAASAMLFLPLCSSPGRARRPQPVSAFEAGTLWSAPQFNIIVHRDGVCTHRLATTLLQSLQLWAEAME